jgi:hypothetical protein
VLAWGLGGAAEAEKCKKARVTLPVLSVLQTVLQHAAEALADKTKELTDVLQPNIRFCDELIVVDRAEHDQ